MIFVGEQRVDLLAVHGDGGRQARQVAVGVGAGDDIDGGILQQFFLQAFGHAAQDADDDAFAALLLLAENVEPTQDALLCIVAHRAGVDQDQVGLFHPLAARIACLLENG